MPDNALLQAHPTPWSVTAHDHYRSTITDARGKHPYLLMATNYAEPLCALVNDYANQAEIVARLQSENERLRAVVDAAREVSREDFALLAIDDCEYTIPVRLSGLIGELRIALAALDAGETAGDKPLDGNDG